MPTISAIMPAYNAEKYIEAAINSVLAQTYRDFELIIVNDGSTDSTQTILENYLRTDNRIKVVTQHNQGIVSALNAAIILASGDFIARMDADDICAPQRFEMQLAAFNSNPKLIVGGTFFQKINKDGHSISGLYNPPVSNNDCKRFLLLQSCFAHPSIMLNKTLIPTEKLRYLQEYIYAEDYKLWSELSEFGDFHNIPKKLLNYRVHELQTSAQKLKAQREVHAKISCENLTKIGLAIEPKTVYDALWAPLFSGGASAKLKLMYLSAPKVGILKYSPSQQILEVTLKTFAKQLLKYLSRRSKTKDQSH